MAGRRAFLREAGLALAALGGSPLRAFAATQTATQPFENGTRDLIAYPQKRPLLRISTRPPHLETPFSVFNQGVLTPNDAFFVRYHLAQIPLTIDADAYRVKVSGKVRRELSLSLADLRALAEPADIVAVNQCSGNSRAFSTPRVFGAQLGNGSMGNARWTGIPLDAVLRHAGLAADARVVAFNGLDRPVLAATPAFVKTLDLDVARRPEVLLAWKMNGTDLPLLNGYPLKLVVPGYFGTYWMKHLSAITVLDGPLTGHDAFFMTTAYRLPDNDCRCVAPGETPSKTVPIGRLKVRSFITSLADAATIKTGRRITIKGIAFDGGTGIKRVELSDNGGTTWRETALGRDLGRFSFREWSTTYLPTQRGAIALQVRAISAGGETQPEMAAWNPGGYQRNAVETLRLTAT